MQRILIFSFCTILVLSISCEEKIFTSDVNCDDCYVIKPDSVELRVNLSITEEYPEIPVVLYYNSIDEGVLIDTYYCYLNPAYIYVKSNREFAAKAIYKNQNRTVFVVDGTSQKLKRVSDYCDETCWVIEDNELFLELAY